MLACVLRADGWEIVYLGQATPVVDAVAITREQNASLLALSVTMAENVDPLERGFGELGRVTRTRSVVIGGAAASAGLAKKVGARYVGGDLAKAVPALRRQLAVSPRARAALAGALAATRLGPAIEPLDKRLLRCDYSDVAVLGKAVTRGPLWRPIGLALHAANGAAFGLAFDEVHRRDAACLPRGSPSGWRSPSTSRCIRSPGSSTATTPPAARTGSRRSSPTRARSSRRPGGTRLFGVLLGWFAARAGVEGQPE